MLAEAVAAVQDLAGAITGIKGAPDNPPESISQFPYAVAYPGASGSVDLIAASFADWQQTIILEIYGSRTLLPKDVALMAPFGEAFLKKLRADPTLGGTVQTATVARCQFGYLKYGDDRAPSNIGWRFEIDVLMHLEV